jgi:seryl-tRNA synthetase
MLNYQCGYVAGQFPKFTADDYWIDGGPGEGGRFLLPTAETALINYHRDEILDEKELPKKYFSYSPCFRREAGSTRLEERGMIRGHQFNKVEMVQLTHPGKSNEAFDELTRKAEDLVQKLGLHYKLSQLAAGDCSFAMGRTHDIEIWIPSMEIYKEVSSASNAYDYQARRGNIRFRDSDGKTRLVHTLNASGLATSRLMPAIVEQYQRADGSVAVPEVLRGDVGADIIS